MASSLNTQVTSPVEADVVNILIVDDLPEKLLVLQSVLENLQQNLVMVRSGREALRQLLEQEFAVILLDVNMPDIDGFETAAMIRNYKKTAQIPIIFITAYADDVQTVHGYSLGAVDYIATPVIPEILRSKVKVFVDLYRMNRQLRQWSDERESLVRAEAGRAAAEEALRRAEFLSQVSNLLTRSLDSEAILQRLLSIAVPSMADVAAVALINDDRAIGSVPTSSIETLLSDVLTVHAVAASAGDHPSNFLIDIDNRNIEITPPRRLLELIRHTLQTQDVSSIQESELLWVYPQAPSADVSAGGAIALCWFIVLPLFAHSRITGALLLGYGAARSYTDNDLALAREVASRASIALENSLLYREIQKGDQRKNEFLAMLAHELRNPLAPIRNAVHIIDQLQLGDTRLDWATQIIGNQVSHIARIVDDLLDVARIARGKVELRNDVVTLSDIIQHSLETSRPHVDARDQKLFVDVPAEQLLLRGDMVRLAQVLSNLLNNASKYTAANGHIWLRAHAVANQIYISVRDNGEGIGAELLPDIFELFRQGTQSMDRTQGGLGVGLTLVKQLVELHGGSVDAQSAGAGLGSEFIVQLPLCSASHSDYNEALPTRVESTTAAPLRVLIVDDQKSSTDTLRRIFEMKKFIAEVAYDGPSALDVVRVFKPDVVILDIGLPGMDGFEVATTMKRLALTDNVFMIALTGYGQKEDVERALSVGFDVHLVKPVEIDQLFSIISEHQFKILSPSLTTKN